MKNEMEGKNALSRGFARQTGRQTDANKQDKTDWMNIIDGRRGNQHEGGVAEFSRLPGRCWEAAGVN